VGEVLERPTSADAPLSFVGEPRNQGEKEPRAQGRPNQHTEGGGALLGASKDQLILLTDQLRLMREVLEEWGVEVRTIEDFWGEGWEFPACPFFV